MASGYAALGKARRKQSKIARERAIGMEAISSVGEIATFAGGQKKKADTAWGEYEAGYKALGGDAANIPERPKFGQKGYFKGPEGDVTIGKKIYDREKIQKAGSFLGSDSATALFAGEGGDKIRTKYLERTVPGRELPTLQQPTQPGATAQVSGVVPTTSQFPTQEYKQTDSRAQYPQGPSLWSKTKSAVEEWGIPVSSAVAGTALTAFNPGALAAGMSLWGPMIGKLNEQYTDKQRQPYMQPQRNAWDSQIENNKNRRPYDLRPPMEY